MKKGIIFFTCLMAASCLMAAQSIEVPAKVTTTFKTKYPQAKSVTWDFDEEEEEYIAEFENQGNTAVAVFEKNGSWVGTTTQLSEEDLMASITEYLSDNHEDADVVYVQKVEDSMGTVYKVTLEEETESDEDETETSITLLSFNENGKLIDEDDDE